MLVDDQPARAALLEQALLDHPYKVIARLSSAEGLAEQVARLEPDVIIIDIESPDRDTLEHMASLHRDNPRPVVMFAEEGDTSSIERAMRAGRQRLCRRWPQSRARENHCRCRRRALSRIPGAAPRTGGDAHAARRSQTDRSRQGPADEAARPRSKQQAYNAMRKMAMDRGQRLAEVASNIIAVFDLLDS